jgi:putative addiction module component (TIGR02574 family)
MPLPKKLLEDALKLEPQSRAELAQRLWSSIDDEEEASLGEVDVDPAFARELERRIAEVESGAVRPVPWSEVKARLESRIRRGG